MTERLLPIVEEQGKATSILRILKKEPWSQKLLSNLEQHNLDTFNHSLRAGVLAFNIATSFNLSPKDVSDLTLAGFLHDIGKLSIPYEVLDAGILNSEEKEIFFEKHANNGRNIVEQFDPRIAEIIGGHHFRREELTSYGPNNPQLAFKQRIIAIADQVDSLISKRPYKRSWNPSATKTHLEKVFESPEIIEIAIQSRMKMTT